MRHTHRARVSPPEVVLAKGSEPPDEGNPTLVGQVGVLERVTDEQELARRHPDLQATLAQVVQTRKAAYQVVLGGPEATVRPMILKMMPGVHHNTVDAGHLTPVSIAL